MTQSDLAEESGVSIQSIKRYETDKGNITIDNLEKIAAALDVSLSYFLQEDAGQGQSITGNGNIQTSGNSNVIGNGNAKPKQLQELFDLIEEYATPRMINELKTKLRKIKEVHDG